MLRTRGALGVLAAGLFLASGMAMAGVQQQEAAAFVLCKNRKDVRTIRVIKPSQESEKCTITYSKGQTEEVVGETRSLNGCRSILKGIQSNLENARWSCRTVGMANVMMSSEMVRSSTLSR